MRLAPVSAFLVVVGCAVADAPAPTPPPTALPGAETRPVLSSIPVSFDDLPGWAEGRHDLALSAFRATCPRFARLADDDQVGPRPGETARGWKQACAAAEQTARDAAAARAFFEARFTPLALKAGESETGLATAYYEPEIQARRTREAPFSEPLARPPANLEAIEAAPGGRQQVFLRGEGGALSPAPPRAVIRRSLGPEDAIAYARLSDVVFLQIQGSGRLLFPDGTRLRAAFAATNGRPYSSIARALADAGVLPIEQASNDNIRAWLDSAAPADADRIVDMNERYVYFAPEPLDAPEQGPRGAAGVPLTADASVAVDPAWHAYGMVFWIAPEGEGAPPARLGVAQDTGAAITGPLRADLFLGSGEAAGRAAARVRHPARWWALAPRDVGEPSGPGAPP